MTTAQQMPGGMGTLGIDWAIKFTYSWKQEGSSWEQIYKQIKLSNCNNFSDGSTVQTKIHLLYNISKLSPIFLQSYSR